MTVTPHATEAPDGAVRRTLMICNERGLHARAAAKFVNVASRFDADLTVTKGDTTVSGRSIMGLMMLAASLGCAVEIRATGPEADAAVQAIADLVDRGFYES